LACKCEMRHEGSELRLVADCRACKNGKGDLEDAPCLSGILEAWTSGMAPDSVVLSGTVERQYSGKALEVLSRMSSLMVELDRLSRRDHPSEASKDVAKRCVKCALAPSKVFGGLALKLRTDPVDFYKEFRDRAVRVSDAGFNEEVCAKCLASTKDDCGFVLDRFEGFLRYVVKEGFSIVL